PHNRRTAEVTREERTAPAEWARAAFEVSGSPLLRGLAEATRTALRRLAEALLTGLTRLPEALLTGLGGLTGLGEATRLRGLLPGLGETGLRLGEATTGGCWGGSGPLPRGRQERQHRERNAEDEVEPDGSAQRVCEDDDQLEQHGERCRNAEHHRTDRLAQQQDDTASETADGGDDRADHEHVQQPGRRDINAGVLSRGAHARQRSQPGYAQEAEEDAQQTGDDTGDRGNHGQDLVALLGALLAVAGLAVTRGRLALRRGRESTAGGVRRLRREPARLGLGAGLLVHR